jgi:hypothetical protein
LKLKILLRELISVKYSPELDLRNWMLIFSKRLLDQCKLPLKIQV